MILSLAGTWQCLETLLVIMTGRATGIEWVEARMLLNILQCTGQPPTTKKCQAVSVNSGVKKPWHGILIVVQWKQN